ncbi:MAG: hypothetical protein PF503_10725 [Desulfobacula sp.]|jgi:hypothetical protein|nr:hypothetical protein [Desulfobacula sp.]
MMVPLKNKIDGDNYAVFIVFEAGLLHDGLTSWNDLGWWGYFG